MEVVVLIWFMCAVVCAFVATSKRRSGTAWFFLGLVGGIFAVIAICAVPPIYTRRPY